MKQNQTSLNFFLLNLPNEMVDTIFSFFNPYTILYDLVISEINSRYHFKNCMKQLKQYCLYDKYNKIISFQKDYILDNRY